MSRPKRSDFSYLTDKEWNTLAALSTPELVQNFIAALPQNFEKDGETCMSVREVLRTKRAHCIEGAIVAALAFWIHGGRPLLMDLEADDTDQDHVIALFKRDGYWGAISKSNHAVNRYRDPIYKTPRELAMSFFHEYYNKDGAKTLRRYSRPYDLSHYKKEDWITEKNAWTIAEDICDIHHYPFLDKRQAKKLRLVDPVQLATDVHLSHYP